MSSSEGSTVDCPDPEEILKKIPELAEDLEEPDDCFTEGTRGHGLPQAHANQGQDLIPHLSKNHWPPQEPNKQDLYS